MGMRDADQAKKDGVQAKNDAETLGYQVEKQLSELKDKMSTADADELKKKLEDLRQVMSSDEPDLIQEKTKDLQEVSWRVTQAAYQQGSADENQEASSEKKPDEEKFKEEKEKK